MGGKRRREEGKERERARERDVSDLYNMGHFTNIEHYFAFNRGERGLYCSVHSGTEYIGAT